MILFEIMFPCRNNTKPRVCRGTRFRHLTLTSVLHRKVPPDGGIFDELAIDRLANEVVQPESGLHFQYANEVFAVWIQPVAVRRCYLK